MDQGGFVIKGSRPPSVASDYRPTSNQSKQHNYHTISRTSFTDESLFGSAHQSKLNEPIKSFKAPWEGPKPLTPGHSYSSVRHYKAVLASKKEKSKDPPLLWCPTPGSSTKYVKSSKALKSDSQVTDCLWNTRSHFRHLKHKPTFVDESLFGKKLDGATFEAPWNDNKKNNEWGKGGSKYSQPSEDWTIKGHNGLKIDLRKRPLSGSKPKRPKSAIGIYGGSENEFSKPIWKP